MVMLGFISMTIILVVVELFADTLSWLSRALAGVLSLRPGMIAGWPWSLAVGGPLAAVALCVSLVACCSWWRYRRLLSSVVVVALVASAFVVGVLVRPLLFFYAI